MKEYQVQVIRSSRRSLSLQIGPDGSIIVRAPLRLPEREIRRFLDEKADWIEKHLQAVLEANRAGENAPLSAADIRDLADKALTDIPQRVAYFAQKMGVTYGRITIRNQKGRWGSCASTGNLNFNCLLMLAPPEVRNYVVIHELSHRRHMDHSAAFWAEVAAVMPTYKEKEKWLKTEGKVLLARMRSGLEE